MGFCGCSACCRAPGRHPLPTSFPHTALSLITTASCHVWGWGRHRTQHPNFPSPPAASGLCCWQPVQSSRCSSTCTALLPLPPSRANHGALGAGRAASWCLELLHVHSLSCFPSLSPQVCCAGAGAVLPACLQRVFKAKQPFPRPPGDKGVEEQTGITQTAWADWWFAFFSSSCVAAPLSLSVQGDGSRSPAWELPPSP